MLRLVTASALLLAMGSGADAADPTATSGAAKPAAAKPAATKTAATKTAPGSSATQVAVLETTQGTIVIKLADKDAPKTAANFRKLVTQKFYDGTCFHRVIRGFMIQGGDPNSKDADLTNDGQGGPGYTVPAEIKLQHVRGAVATARLGDGVNPGKASSGSQFFIDVANQPSLDQGGYTVFGHVISGMDAVDKIVAFSDDASLPPAGGGGRNPAKKAQITKAYLEPLAKWEKPAAAAEKPEEKIESKTADNK
jgi:cyclophilin family peptidyl-prolyl cis-trans isomerase